MRTTLEEIGRVFSKNEYRISLIGISLFFLFVFGPAILAKFYIVEDHLLVSDRIGKLRNVASIIADDIYNFKRVRPLYWVYLFLGSRIFGTNPHLWHASVILYGIVTCFLLYVSIRRSGGDAVSGVVFVLLLVLSADQSWIWVNLIPQETLGMLLCAVGVSSIVSASRFRGNWRFDAIGLCAIGLAGFVKESFVLIMPACLLLRLSTQIYFKNQGLRKAAHDLRRVMVAGCFICIGQVLIIVVVVGMGGASEGAKGDVFSTANVNLLKWPSLIKHFGLGSALVGAGIIWIGSFLLESIKRRYLLLAVGVFGAWVIPQFAVYGDGIQERYLFPAIVGIAGSITFSLAILFRSKVLWPGGIIGTVLLVTVVGNGFSASALMVRSFVAETKATDRMIQFVAKNVPDEQVILMGGDSGTPYGFEATYSLPVYLRLAGSKSPFFLWPLVSTGERSESHIAASEGNTRFRYPDSICSKDVGAVIIVDKWIPGFDIGPLMEWLKESSWREVLFSERFSTFSFQKGKNVSGREVRHRILLSTSSVSVPSDKGLLVVDRKLHGVVNAGPFFYLPEWGLEADFAGPGSVVWLGHGEEEGLGFMLFSSREGRIRISLEIVPGPSRPDLERTIEVSIRNKGGSQTLRQTQAETVWYFDAEVQRGANLLRIAVMDEATVSLESVGDSRKLMALVRRIILTTP